MYLVIIERELSSHMSRDSLKHIWQQYAKVAHLQVWNATQRKRLGEEHRCIIVRGLMWKDTHYSNNACPFDKMSNTIVFLIIFYPKIMYDMTYLEQGCT